MLRGLTCCVVLVVSVHTAPQNGRVELTFAEPGRTAAVVGTLYYQYAGGWSRQRHIADFSRPLVLDDLPPGLYRLTVVATSLSSALVASRVSNVQITGQSTMSVTVDLVEREGYVRVVDAAGAPAGGAHFYTNPSATNSSADDEGGISLATLATGTMLTVRTIHWGVTCHRVTDAPRQTVVVPDATEALVIAAPTTPTSGLPQRRIIVPSAQLAGATLSGIPGADCAVPYEHFPVTMVNTGGRTEHTMLLPYGEYTLTLRDGTKFRVQAPGRVELR
jgi:hypothetical protein